MLQSALLTAALLVPIAEPALGALILGPEELVQAGGADITVPGYSAPTLADWNSDGLNDLVIGEGGGYRTPAVRVYLNQGTPSQPQFSDFFYAVKPDAMLVTYVGTECSCAALGLYPRVLYWDGDARKDLLVGQFDGTVRIYLNVGTDENPVFDDGAFLQVGQPGATVDIDVGDIAGPTPVDWNSDGTRDLVVGAEDGRVHYYLNVGSDTQPDYRADGLLLAEDGSDLVVAGEQSTPVILDLDGDGKRDLLAGNVPGELLFYRNVGTDEAPRFSGYSRVASAGVPIVVDAVSGASPRSRPFVCDWTGDGRPDVLIGAGDGKIYLYQGIPEAATLSLFSVGALSLLGRRRHRRRRR